MNRIRSVDGSKNFCPPPQKKNRVINSGGHTWQAKPVAPSLCTSDKKWKCWKALFTYTRTVRTCWVMMHLCPADTIKESWSVWSSVIWADTDIENTNRLSGSSKQTPYLVKTIVSMPSKVAAINITLNPGFQPWDFTSSDADILRKRASGIARYHTARIGPFSVVHRPTDRKGAVHETQSSLTQLLSAVWGNTRVWRIVCVNFTSPSQPKYLCPIYTHFPSPHFSVFECSIVHEVSARN